MNDALPPKHWPPYWPGVTDRDVRTALARVPRHLFVPPEYRDRAYEDIPLPIGLGQTISQPYIVALMTQALRLAPNDYAGLLMMAKCQLALRKPGEAERYADQAKAAYRDEPQASHVAGVAKVSGRKFEAALQEFAAYEKRLPGNPNTIFFQGYCSENG